MSRRIPAAVIVLLAVLAPIAGASDPSSGNISKESPTVT
jgi:hypothetical protein